MLLPGRKNRSATPTMPRPSSRAGITTREGRVVYDRKTHKFTEKDLARVMRLMERPADSAGLMRYIENLTKEMLDAILALVGLNAFTDDVYIFIRDLIERILSAIFSRPAVNARPETDKIVTEMALWRKRR